MNKHQVTLEDDPLTTIIAKEVGVAPIVRDHLEPEEDVCGYCGQCFGPESIVVERDLYGKKWHFCDEQCFDDFREHSNFKDEDLDGERSNHASVDLPEDD